MEGRLAKDLGLSAVAAAWRDAVPSATAAPMGVAAQTRSSRCCAQPEATKTRRALSGVAPRCSASGRAPARHASGGVELLAAVVLGPWPARRSASRRAATTANPRDGSRDDAGADAGPRRDVQLQYEVSLCAWLLTFHAPALAAMRRGAFAEGLMEVAKRATKEKVARVAVLALRNIAEGVASAARSSDDASREDRRGSVSAPGPGLPREPTVRILCLFCGASTSALAKLVANLQQRSFADEELPARRRSGAAPSRARATRARGIVRRRVARLCGRRRTATRVSGASARRV